MSAASIAPKQIMTTIQQENPTTFITASDIQNEHTTNRLNYLQQRTSIEALLDELLASSDWIHEVRRDSDNHI
jgi:hypothetical protein